MFEHVVTYLGYKGTQMIVIRELQQIHRHATQINAIVTS